MTAAERLRALAAALPADGAVTFTRTDLLELVAGLDGAAGNDEGWHVDLDVEEAAALLGRSPSTVRAWAAAELLPGAYRFNGREWRIPRNAIAALQRAAAEEHSRSARHTSRPRAADTSAWRAAMPADSR